jgi:hypothetical protein
MPSILVDPAIEKWYHMKENTQYYYKLNTRTVRYAAISLIAVPALLFYGYRKYHLGFELRGLRRK